MSPAEREKFFRGIRSSAYRLRRLADDLTAASQLQGPGMRFRMADVSLHDLVHSAVARRAAADPGVHVDVDVPVEVVVHADEVRLAQALDNLLDNAVRHGAAPRTMSTEVRDGQVQIKVTDAGRGVPDEVAPRLFDRFATAGATGGTGLGLYLVREIMRGHGGDASYQPPGPGNPTSFVVEFPVAPRGGDPEPRV